MFVPVALSPAAVYVLSWSLKFKGLKVNLYL
jgi:hypothetical protein